MWQDLALALRGLRVRPGFAVVTVVTLALGIGANTAVFSVVDAVVLRPLPYGDPERLFFISATGARDGERELAVSVRELEVWRRQIRSFGALAGASAMNVVIFDDGSGSPAAVETLYASANLLETLEVTPARGRGFLPEEDVPAGRQVALLSHASWQRRFASDPAVVGKTLTLQNVPTTVVGVLPEGVHFLDPGAEIWLPLARHPSARNARRVQVVGRLLPGAAPEGASAELVTVARRLEVEEPATHAGLGLRMVGVHERLTRGVRPALLLLLAAVGLVLLIACANLANLMLARALGRNLEMAVRVALGAPRWRLVRQLVTEGLVLALAGGIAGLLLARWGTDLALRFGPAPLTALPPAAINAPVLAFSLALSLLSGLAFSLAPVWQVLEANPQSALAAAGGGRATAGRRQRGLSGLLVVVEMAVALVLLVGAGLLTRSVSRLLGVDPGFATRGLLTAQVHMPPGGLGDRARHIALYRQLEDELRALPGVTAVGSVSHLPFMGARPNMTHALDIEGRPVGTGTARLPEIDVRQATTDYFSALGIPLRAGRLVTLPDRNQVVINDVAARRYWPGEDPLGKRVRTVNSAGGATDWQTVVGVVGAVRHLALEIEPRPEVYYHMNSAALGFYALVVRTSVDPKAAVATVRGGVQRVNRQLTLSRMAPMEELIARSVASRRFGTGMLVVFAIIAIVLAAVGLYGVMSYAVARQSQEIAVRMALGAGRTAVVGLVVRRGMALAALGAAIGTVAAVAAARLAGGLVHGVSGTDPATFLGAPLVLMLVAFLSCYLPARRATKLAPMMALRQG